MNNFVSKNGKLSLEKDGDGELAVELEAYDYGQVATWLKPDEIQGLIAFLQENFPND